MIAIAVIQSASFVRSMGMAAQAITAAEVRRDRFV
jgi:hypothetical protein